MQVERRPQLAVDLVAKGLVIH
ncbi:MAG: hypothetical protein K940chlam7_01782, partial [Chlamydiae bacterium]|nr:hypothetical protein [Chlamydiota bacterium]NGX43484.1 hypothetical protein [Chlamydiota bacterium]